MLNIGDKILCVNDHICDESKIVLSLFNFNNFIKVGRIYTIRNICKAILDNSIGLRLEEIICPINPLLNNEFAWNSKLFRKIDFNKNKPGGIYK